VGGIIGTPNVTIEQRLAALLTVAHSICAVLAAFWVSWRLTPATPLQYVGGNLLLSVCPALVVWTGRRSFSTAVVLAGVVTTIFTLTAVFGVHCRYFLATPPRSIFVLLGIFLGGFGWIALTLVWLRLSMRRSRTPVNQPRSLRLVSAFVVAVRVVSPRMTPSSVASRRSITRCCGEPHFREPESGGWLGAAGLEGGAR
jgi:hypothetical protein